MSLNSSVCSSDRGSKSLVEVFLLKLIYYIILHKLFYKLLVNIVGITRGITILFKYEYDTYSSKL